MNTEIKLELFEKIKNELANKESVNNIIDVNDNKNYHLSFIMYNRLKADLTLMKKGDMLKIVATQNYPDLNDKDLYELAQVITANTKINFTTYQDQLKLQTIYPFANIDNKDEANQGCLDTINKFIDTLGKHVEKLGKVINEDKVVNEEDKQKEIKQDHNSQKDLNDNLINKEMENNSQNVIEENKEITKEKSEPSSDFERENKTEIKIINEKVNNGMNSSMVKQMNEMYAEMDRIFQHRKEVADFRENTLNKLKETLELKEKEIKELILNKDKIFEDQNQKLEEKY